MGIVFTALLNILLAQPSECIQSYPSFMWYPPCVNEWVRYRVDWMDGKKTGILEVSTVGEIKKRGTRYLWVQVRMQWSPFFEAEKRLGVGAQIVVAALVAAGRSDHDSGWLGRLQVDRGLVWNNYTRKTAAWDVDQVEGVLRGAMLNVIDSRLELHKTGRAQVALKQRKLECDVWQGQAAQQYGSGETYRLRYQVFTHPSIPTGVVKAVWKVRLDRPSRQGVWKRIILELEATGRGARPYLDTIRKAIDQGAP